MQQSVILAGGVCLYTTVYTEETLKSEMISPTPGTIGFVSYKGGVLKVQYDSYLGVWSYCITTYTTGATTETDPWWR